MDTSAALSVGLTRTPARGWAVVLLARLQTGWLTLCGLTSVGIIAGLLYPRSRQRAGAAEVIRS